MRRVRTLLVPAVAGVLLLASASPVAAGATGDNTLSIGIQPAVPFERAVPTFEFEYDTDGDDDCEASLEFSVIDGEDAPVADVDITQGTLTLGPSVPGGSYDLVATCTDDDEDDLEDVAGFAFARGIVEKVVEGDAGDATFTVEVACEGEGRVEEVAVAGGGEGGPFTLEFEYGPEGGDELFVVYNETACEVTETEDGGADSVEITGGAAEDGGFTFPDAMDETVTVTNTFEGEPAEEAPAAVAEVAEPNLTG